MYRKLFWSATKDCSGAGNPLGNVDVGEMAFILVMCAVIVEKISLAGTNPESLRLSLRISLILRKFGHGQSWAPRVLIKSCSCI